MRLTEALNQHLLADAAVAALVVTRIYPKVLPQPVTLPAIAYSRISQDEDLAADGATGFFTVRVQVDAYASTYDGARALGDAIRAALHGKQFPGVEFCALIPPGEQDLHEDEVQSSRVSVDYLVCGTED